MDRRRILAIILLVIALLIVVSVPVWLFTPLGANVLDSPPDLNAPPLTPVAFTPAPKATPQAVLVPQGAPGTLLAGEAILLNADTGTILYEKNAETEVPMASTTKIMTALIAIQSGKLDQIITVGQDAVDQDQIGSSAGLHVGDRLSLKDLLYGLMLPSGDDAAVAIADGVAGSVEAFAHIMNVEAQRLHLFQTHFFDPTGLDTYLNLQPIPAHEHYTTAYDLARLTRYAMSIPLFAQIVKTRSYTLPPSSAYRPIASWENTNTMLTTYAGTLGVKTGWTGAAGGCLVTIARRNGHTLLGVVLHSSGPNTTEAQDFVSRVKDSTTLLDWGFSLPVQVPRF